MKQFKTVYKFELSNFLRNKIFIITTILFMILAAVGISALSYFSNKENDSNDKETPKFNIIVVDKYSTNMEDSREYFSSLGIFDKIDYRDASVDELKQLIDNKEYDYGLILNSYDSFEVVTSKSSLTDSPVALFSRILAQRYQVDELIAKGFTLEESLQILNTVPKGTIVQVGKDQAEHFFFTYVLIMALYIMVLLYGQMIATAVATEKSSRAMEMLISSAKPTSLIFGKVLGVGTAGFLQMASILTSALIFIGIFRDKLTGNALTASIVNINFSVGLYAIIFFVLGYLLYSFLFAALSSMASRTEDAATLSSPVMLLFVGTFLITIYSMVTGKADSMLVKVCSFIPFTSPLVMFMRITMTVVPIWQVFISVTILFASTIGIGYLSAAIYRAGVLMYGKKPRPKEIIAIIKRLIQEKKQRKNLQ